MASINQKNKITNFTRKSNRGFSLVELVVFIVIVTTAIAGVVGALSWMSGHSADPLARKQALAIAESLMQEIQQMPFTFCDPDDPNAATAVGSANCTTTPQNANLNGPTPASESRYSANDPFDNVADYGGFTMPGGGCASICRIGSNASIPGLTAYTAAVAITQAGGTAPFTGMAADAALKIVVTVTGPANTIIRLTGFKVRYAPSV